ncbi:hypothetical protein CYMTET_14644 [Cymbomonas tetramitiformis]|uniref:Uncharacterized protein n=1 Tax=Cymbomonas tetramitiformis TaxID=36881 RepID=A0AAE0LA66_9CHLO|nr:hypothetical protein CYMTET_14644 [Cymbomonas tetramitiformis]
MLMLSYAGRVRCVDRQYCSLCGTKLHRAMNALPDQLAFRRLERAREIFGRHQLRGLLSILLFLVAVTLYNVFAWHMHTGRSMSPHYSDSNTGGQSGLPAAVFISAARNMSESASVQTVGTGDNSTRSLASPESRDILNDTWHRQQRIRRLPIDSISLQHSHKSRPRPPVPSIPLRPYAGLCVQLRNSQKHNFSNARQCHNPLASEKQKDYPGVQLVMGLGTGRTGSMSLTLLLVKQQLSSAKADHPNVHIHARGNLFSHEAVPSLPWEIEPQGDRLQKAAERLDIIVERVWREQAFTTPGVIPGSIKGCTLCNSKGRALAGDVASSYLMYVEAFLALDSCIKFIVLERGKTQVVQSFLSKSEGHDHWRSRQSPCPREQVSRIDLGEVACWLLEIHGGLTPSGERDAKTVRSALPAWMSQLPRDLNT